MIDSREALTKVTRSVQPLSSLRIRDSGRVLVSGAGISSSLAFLRLSYRLSVAFRRASGMDTIRTHALG